MQGLFVIDLDHSQWSSAFVKDSVLILMLIRTILLSQKKILRVSLLVSYPRL